MPFRSDCVQLQFGDGVAQTAQAISIIGFTATHANVITTLDITGTDGDVIQIANQLAPTHIDGFHCVDRGINDLEVRIYDGRFPNSGSSAGAGTVQIMNTVWSTLAETASISITESKNISESPHLDDCTGIVEKVITTVNASATIEFDWLPKHPTHNLVNGIRYLTRNKANVWWRIKNLAVDEVSPPYHAFQAVISQFDLSITNGELQRITLGLGLNTEILSAS